MRTLKDIEYRLSRRLEKGDLRLRDGPSRKTLEYLSGGDVALALNYAAGPLGWDTRIDQVDLISVERVDGLGRPNASGDKWTAIARCKATVVVRGFIDLQTGAYERASRQDIGHGSSEKQPSREQAIEFAEKSAATDAIKRAVRFFGPQTGLLLMFKEEERDGVQAMIEAGIAEVHNQHPQDYQTETPPTILHPPQPTTPRPAVRQALDETAAASASVQPTAATAPVAQVKPGPAEVTAPSPSPHSAPAPSGAPPTPATQPTNAAAPAANGPAPAATAPAANGPTPAATAPVTSPAVASTAAPSAPAAPAQGTTDKASWQDQAQDLEARFNETYGAPGKWSPPGVLRTFADENLVHRITADPADAVASASLIERQDANAFHGLLKKTYGDVAAVALWRSAGVELKAGVQITRGQIVRLAATLEQAARSDVDVATWLSRQQPQNGTAAPAPQAGQAQASAGGVRLEPQPQPYERGGAKPDAALAAEIVKIIGAEQKEIVESLSTLGDDELISDAVGRAIHAIAVERLLQLNKAPTEVFAMWQQIGWNGGTPDQARPNARQARALVRLIPERQA